MAAILNVFDISGCSFIVFMISFYFP
jgi:hypothetical protein